VSKNIFLIFAVVYIFHRKEFGLHCNLKSINDCTFSAWIFSFFIEKFLRAVLKPNFFLFLVKFFVLTQDRNIDQKRNF